MINIEDLRPYSIVSAYDMLRIYADKFVKLNSFVTAMITAAMAHPKQSFNPIEDDPIIERCKELKVLCEDIGLTLSTMKITRVIEQFSTESEISAPALRSTLEDLRDRIDDELKSLLMMTITGRNVEFYETVNLFGDEVADKFPSANFDIEENGKCFATARYTACVMHLQRVIEVGLKGFGTYLGIYSHIKTAQPSWNKVLELTAKEIKDRTIAKSWGSSTEQEYAEGIQAFLVAVKTAWRNPSMHADKTYGEEIAEDIYNAVKSFMRHLAGHLDEKGKYVKTRKKKV